jgi:hypothetical protein
MRRRPTLRRPADGGGAAVVAAVPVAEPPWATFAAAGVLPAARHDPAAGALRFVGRPVTVDDLDAVYALHLEAVDSMTSPGLVRRDERAYFESHVDGDGFILGVFCDGCLVGYGLTSFPRDGSENYGVVLGLPAGELPLVGQLEGAAVGVAHWGRGLHRRLATWRAEVLAAAGYRHICATVAPGNVWSMRNLLRTGLVIRCVGHLYGGLLRFVMQRDEAAPTVLVPGTEVTVPLDDIGRQAALMADGYVGHDCLTYRPGVHGVVYSRREGA